MRRRPMPGTIDSMPGTLSVLLNMTSFGLTALGLVGLLVAVSLLYKAPTRPCHRCGRRVPLGRRVCRDCGYDFEPVRFSR
jgi:hypothetical protein